MSAFEYFVVLSSLILGLGIAQILQGFSDLVAHYDKIRFSIVHTVYAVVVFIIHLQDWWYTYQYSMQIESWTFLLSISLLSFHIVLFLQARILFPTGQRSGETDMVAYFAENWRLLYFLGSITVLHSIISNIFLSGYSFVEQIHLIVYFLVYQTFIFFRIQNFYAHVTFVSLQLVVAIIAIATDTNSIM